MGGGGGGEDLQNKGSYQGRITVRLMRQTSRPFT